MVNDKLTGKEYACKSIVKRLDVPNMSVSKQAAYLDNVKREIAVLRRLQGTLNVVQFFGAFEDDEHIHAVMEYCRGGELHNRIGRRHYSERVVRAWTVPHASVHSVQTACHMCSTLEHVAPGLTSVGPQLL